MVGKTRCPLGPFLGLVTSPVCRPGPLPTKIINLCQTTTCRFPLSSTEEKEEEAEEGRKGKKFRNYRGRSAVTPSATSSQYKVSQRYRPPYKSRKARLGNTYLYIYIYISKVIGEVPTVSYIRKLYILYKLDDVPSILLPLHPHRVLTVKSP